jgi:cytochrome c553
MKTTFTARIALAALIAAFSLPSLAASGNAEAGRKKSEPCKACHGEGGISQTPDFPNLAGQHADYLTAAINHYKNGKRKNAIMQGQVANLTQRDILDLTSYYSSLAGLKTKY